MSALQLATWTLPVSLQIGGYFLYVGLLLAGSWHWWRKAPGRDWNSTAPADGEALPGAPDRPAPPDSSPAERSPDQVPPSSLR